MAFTMKVSFSHLAIIAAGFLVLAASCQQTNKAESKSSWQLKSPGTAAGYGAPPLDADKPKDTTPAPPAGKNGRQEMDATQNEPAGQPPAGTVDAPDSSAPAIMIAPPPSAAGYGRVPLDTNGGRNSSTEPPADEKDLQEAPSTAVKQEPEPAQPAIGSNKPIPSAPVLLIAPPPSAAGYGGPLLDAPTGKKSSPAPPQPVTENSVTKPPAPAWKILPPPSAAGYGK